MRPHRAQATTHSRTSEPPLDVAPTGHVGLQKAARSHVIVPETSDWPKTCSRQRLDLSVPRIPEFRKALEQNDEGAIFRASSDRVQADIAILDGEVFHGASAFRAV